MYLEAQRNRLVIVPVTEQDKAYIEDTLGLKREGDYVKLVRIAPIGFSTGIAYLKAEKDREAE